MSDSNTIAATGRRKTAVARVRMTPGDGQITINKKAFEEYVPTIALQNNLLSPLQVAEASQKWDIVATTKGGGLNAQVDAIRLGISRALVEFDSELRPALKQKGLMTRDPRAKER